MARGYPDFEGHKSKLYSGADWAAIEAYDMSFANSGTNVATDTGITETYVVLPGTTLYIVQGTWKCAANLAADRDNNQIAEFFLRKLAPAPTIHYCNFGGNGGGQVSFPKPLVFIAGQTFQILLYNRSNHNCNLAYAVGGYLI